MKFKILTYFIPGQLSGNNLDVPPLMREMNDCRYETSVLALIHFLSTKTHRTPIALSEHSSSEFASELH